MQRQSHDGANPGKLFCRFGRQGQFMGGMLMAVVTLRAVIVIVPATVVGIPFWQIMVVKVEEALHEKHGQESPEHPGHRAVERLEFFGGMGQEMQQGDAKHETRHEAGGHLQADMGQPHQQWQPPARQRGEKDQQTVNGQNPDGRNHCITHSGSPR